MGQTPLITPSFVYGTAWKKEATTELVKLALSAGFTAIDTANQPRHYSEALVGDALHSLAGSVRRESLFIQTKFTPLNGQDNRVPYNPESPLAAQVSESFESSLRHLKTDYVDSYLLHGPYTYPGLGDEDWQVWKAIEGIYKSGRARMIGVSNVNVVQLSSLIEHAETKPMVVQNRCFANRGWDRSVREVCKIHRVMYQGFSLLTANPYVLHHPGVQAIATKAGVQPEQVIFRFAMQVGMVPLTGTTNLQHMKEDLRVYDFKLAESDVNLIETIAA